MSQVYCVIIALAALLCCHYANGIAHSSAKTRGENNDLVASRAVVVRRQQRSDQQQQSSWPKLVQWAKEAVQYYEGSTLVLSCSLATSAPSANNPVKFAWFKQGKPLALPNQATATNQRLSVETLADYSFLRLSQLRSGDSGAYTCVASNAHNQEDRTTAQVIVNVKLRWLDRSPNNESSAQDGSGTSNLIGQHELVTVRAGAPIVLECGAAAQPLPRIRWYRLVAPPVGGHQRQQSKSPPQLRLDEAHIRSSLMQDDTLLSYHRLELANIDDLMRSRGAASANESVARQWRAESHSAGQHEMYSQLILDRAEANSNGLYECEASSSSSSSEQVINQQANAAAVAADRLRKFFGVLVNGQ